MLNPTFEHCVAYTTMEGLPQGLKPYYDTYIASGVIQPLISEPQLINFCTAYQAGTAGTARLLEALAEINADPVLLSFSQFLVADLCVARHRMQQDDYRALTPKSKMKNADLYAFLLLLSCIHPSLQRLEQTGMPKELYQNIPPYMVEKQMKKLRESGSGEVEDFPWDLNFYTGRLFRIGRFNFIPFPLDDDIAVYRKGEQVIAFYTTPKQVRQDGQLNGVNQQFDPDFFTSTFQNKDGSISGYPILPSGLISPNPVTLQGQEWQLVLQKGDYLLGFHIPGGPGYTPETMRKDSAAALELYQRYFPEIPLKGIGSESWLYDPHVAALLQGSGNIASMQQQMYIYPIESGDSMLWGELFGGKVPLEEAPKTTRLQKLAVDYMKQNGRFTTCAFFVLAEEIAKIGTGPYASPAEYKAAWHSILNPRPFFEKEAPHG